MSWRASQRGLALISALLIVSLASILAATRMFHLQLESQSSRTLIDGARARLVALGIEELAIELLARDALDSDTDHYGESWARGTGAMSVGPMQVRGTIEDMQGRFNLNNLVTLQGTPDRIALRQFQRLLRTLGLDESIAGKALDWVDADNLPQASGGAEDEAYTRLDPPYQAPNRPMEDVSELMAVEGVDAEAWRVLAPHVTALPVAGSPVPVNVNTASEAVLLSLSENPDTLRVQRWRQQQLSGGLSNLREVQDSLPPAMAGRVSLSSRWFSLRLAAQADGTRFFLTSLLDRSGGQARARWRRQGLPPEAWLAPVQQERGRPVLREGGTPFFPGS